MEYTYEFLRKCHGLRFRATICNKPQEGIIKVTREGVILCYGQEDPGYLATFGRRDTLSFSKQTFSILPGDFEIVPRDPETYQDWQVGDKVTERPGETQTVIFRSGELMVTKQFNGEASCPFTCGEFFEKGYRLVLTDIEKQIIEEKQKIEWTPKDGDICYSSLPMPTIFVKEGDEENHRYYKAYIPDKDYLSSGSGRIAPEDFQIDIRPATDAEKQLLFKALAKVGKRWNAEMKIVEDIEPEDVQKMISDALTGYTPKGDIEGFPIEVIAKMLERQYEQSGKINIEGLEYNRIAIAPRGFNWDETTEGYDFWDSVIFRRDFPKFYKLYPKEKEGAAAEIPFSFKKFAPVLVRSSNMARWKPSVFHYMEIPSCCPFVMIDGSAWPLCLPLNDKTEHLLGTTDNYKEE